MPRHLVASTAEAWRRDKAVRVKGIGFAVRQSWLQVPAWPLPTCVTLGMSLNVLEIQFLGMRIIHHRALMIK